MSAAKPIYQARYAANEIKGAGSALCALGDVFKAVDRCHFDNEFTWEGLGELLGILGLYTHEKYSNLMNAIDEVDRDSAV